MVDTYCELLRNSLMIKDIILNGQLTIPVVEINSKSNDT